MGLINGYTTYSKKTLQFIVVAGATDLSTGDGKLYFNAGPELDGGVIVGARAWCSTAPTTQTISIQLHNVTDAVDVFSTLLTIDATEKTSSTAATPVVINAANDDVSDDDEFRIDIDQVGSGTVGKGLRVEIDIEIV